MEKVKEFICDFIESERQLKVLERQIGKDEFNKQYKFYTDFISAEAQGNLGITERNKEYNQRFADRYKNLKPPRARELFKIEKYEHADLGEVYFAYVSNYTPAVDYKNLDEILIISEIDKEFKILGKIFLPHFKTKAAFSIDKLDAPIDLSKLDKFVENEIIQSPDEETIPFTSEHIPLKTNKS